MSRHFIRDNMKLRLIFNRLPIWLSLFCQVSADNYIECKWNREYLCGDKCLSNYNTCTCGNDTLAYQNLQVNYFCCNHEPCVLNSDGNVHCVDGKKVDYLLPCNGACRQYATWPGIRFAPCKDGKQCYIELLSCKGSPQCLE